MTGGDVHSPGSAFHNQYCADAATATSSSAGLSTALVLYDPANAEVAGADMDEDRVDLEVGVEDNAIPSGSGFIYDDEIINDMMNDRFGARRAATEHKKTEMIGTHFIISGQTWTVTKNMEVNETSHEEFMELGIRSNTLDFDALPNRFRTRTELERGKRASPRITPRRSAQRDESKAIESIFLTLYPVHWKQSLKRLNRHIRNDHIETRRKYLEVSENEYWKFIGLIILCAVQKTGGAESLWNSKETQGLVQRVQVNEYMSETRFKFIKKVWPKQFQLDIDDDEKESNKWWEVGHLVHGFNKNRQVTIASSRVKTMDESMSAFKPRTTKTGNLPNISYIMRKPQPLGTELKTVASKGSNGPMIWAEVQEGKIGMQNKKYFTNYGATSSCVLRLAKGTLDGGQKKDPLIRNLYYGDSWFASLKTAVALYEKVGAEFVGPIKTAHSKFPKAYLEKTLKDWAPGSHLLMQTTVNNNKYYAIGYKYSMRKVLSFIATQGAGSTKPGIPYEAKWTDVNGNPASRNIARPQILSDYFAYSNQIDKHNHVRQSELAIEKHVGSTCGYFRLFQTYLGITITDAWKVYRHSLGDKCENKSISIHSFANILCKSLVSNKFRRHENTKFPKQTNRQINTGTTTSRRELEINDVDVPEEIIHSSTRTLSSIGSSGPPHGLVCIGNGKYVPSSFEPHHKHATCTLTNNYINVEKGSYSEKRRKRKKCRECRKNTRWTCSACGFALCSPDSICFTTHKTTKILNERESYWASIQTD